MEQTEASTAKMSFDRSSYGQNQLGQLQEDEIRMRSQNAQHRLPLLYQMMNKRDVIRLLELKENLILIRERKAVVIKVPDPQVVDHFARLKEMKKKQLIRSKLKERIEEKKKELSKLRHLYKTSELQFQEKSEVFKQKSALLRVLGGKMETELTKTKERYRQVQFNRVIVQGVRKVLYYRLTEILFNENVRSIFNVVFLANMFEYKDEDNVGNCLGYLTLFVVLVGSICGARMWINFTFKGPRSTIRLSDGSIITLHPREPRLSEGLKLLGDQLSQMMQDTMQLKLMGSNFLQLCQQLTKQILAFR